MYEHKEEGKDSPKGQGKLRQEGTLQEFECRRCGLQIGTTKQKPICVNCGIPMERAGVVSKAG